MTEFDQTLARWNPEDPRIKHTVGDPRIRLQARDLIDRIISSGRFSWLGLIERTDELQRSRLTIYLLEQPQESSSGLDITPAFTPLARTLEPQPLDLYFMDGSRYSPVQAKEHITKYCGTLKPKAKLVWNTSLPT